MNAEPERSNSPRVHRMRRCPKCGAVTERPGHCFVKGPPLFPQLDDDTPTELCDVLVLSEVLNELPFHTAIQLAEWFGVTDDQWSPNLDACPRPDPEGANG